MSVLRSLPRAVPRSLLPTACFLAVQLLCADLPEARAQAEGGAAPAALERVEVEGRHYDNAVGSSDAASQGHDTRGAAEEPARAAAR
jgi:hypothetical protein